MSQVSLAPPDPSEPPRVLGDLPEGKPRRPHLTLRVDPEHWDPDFALRKQAPELVGLRRISQGTKDRLELSAAEYALHAFPADERAQILAYNERLISLVLSEAMCSPNDQSKPFFAFPEEQGPRAFTSEFLRVAWAKYSHMLIMTSPTEHEVQDDELDSVRDVLTAGHLARIPETRRRQLRRVLGYLRDELTQKLG